MSTEQPERPLGNLSHQPVEPGAEPTARLESDPRPDGVESWQDQTGRRQLSVSHLVAGLVFLGIAGLWLAQEVGAVAVDDLDLLVPMLLVMVGAAGLVVSLARVARNRS